VYDTPVALPLPFRNPPTTYIYKYKISEKGNNLQAKNAPTLVLLYLQRNQQMPHAI